MVTEEMVWDKLKQVPDPEMGVNIVDLGLIYKVELFEMDTGEQEVRILMTLTSPACPLAGTFDELVGGAVRMIDGVGKCIIDITFDPPWSMEKMTEEGKAELGFF